MREKQKQPASFQPDRILSYFKAEWKVLLAVTISGLIYNVGLLAGPWFEGKMTGCLVDILRGAGQFGDMLILVLSYVAVIVIVQSSRYIKPIGIGKEGYIMADKNPKHMLKKKQVKAKDKKKHIYE